LSFCPAQHEQGILQQFVWVSPVGQSSSPSTNNSYPPDYFLMISRFYWSVKGITKCLKSCNPINQLVMILKPSASLLLKATVTNQGIQLIWTGFSLSTATQEKEVFDHYQRVKSEWTPVSVYLETSQKKGT